MDVVHSTACPECLKLTEPSDLFEIVTNAKDVEAFSDHGEAYLVCSELIAGRLTGGDNAYACMHACRHACMRACV